MYRLILEKIGIQYVVRAMQLGKFAERVQTEMKRWRVISNKMALKKNQSNYFKGHRFDNKPNR